MMRGQRPWRAPWNALFIACLLVVSFPVSLRAQAPAVTLQVSPAAIKLAPGEQAHVLVTATNLLLTPLQELRLTGKASARTLVTLTSSQPDSLASQASYAWEIELTQTTESADSDTVTLQLDYKFKSESGALTPRIAIAVVDVQPRIPETIDKIAQARVESAVDAIQENRPGTVYLIISNISNAPITITRISMDHSDSVSIQLPSSGGPGTIIPPQESVTLAYQVSAQDRVQPGKDLLLFHVQVETRQSNQTLRGILHASTKFDVGVLGESALLTIFSVPSFLLLPGLLMVVSFRLLRRYLSNQPWSFDIKDPALWFLAVLLSFGAAYVYPILTGVLFQTPRNYLTRYGLQDLWWVWIGALIAGLIGWIAWWVAEKVIAWVRQRWFIPQSNDTPETTLHKLARRRGASFALEHVVAEVGGRTQNALVIERDTSAKRVWLVPIARYQWQAGAPTEFCDEFDLLLEQADNPDRIANRIALAKKTEWMKIDWDCTRGALTGPQQVAESQTKPVRGPRRRMIEETQKKAVLSEPLPKGKNGSAP